MSYLDNFRYWRDSEFFDEETRNELKLLDEEKNKKEVEDRFYKDLEFGTAGLRGIMGVGSNRINKYTVGKATVGFANYLMAHYGNEECLTRGVVIAYDTRNNSKYFAGIAADVFSAIGVKVNLLKETYPIPVMSYAIRKLGAIGGVVITASHNPREYNGYKAYDETGCQLTPEVADSVIEYVNSITDYSTINFSANTKLIRIVDLIEDFVIEILKQSRISDNRVKENLNIVYTPIHGSGYVPVMKVLQADGFTNVNTVKEQIKPDGDFPTVSAPNPEAEDALNLGIKKAKELNADIVLGTDPDADRVGIAVRTNDGFKLLNGNQIGALLVDFLIQKLDRKTMKKPAIIKSIVTSELGAQIARRNNVSVLSTLIGFKFIGEKMTEFEKAKKEGDNTNDFDFLIGYEESYGYLVGMHARDKDAVVSTMLICEMAAYQKSLGKTLLDRLNEIYEIYGYFMDVQDSKTLKGKDGLDQIENMMKTLRIEGSPFEEKCEIIDYMNPIETVKNIKSNILVYKFENDSWVAVRPSGNEPKIKIYYSVKALDEKEASQKIKEYQKMIKLKLGL